ncbi:MAG TPA: hypothetical protein PLD54_04385 [Candidatus Levybacteria bacterium]|nr:hypothetical protein [Candidatus Levybacteria bacterium]
MLQNIAIILEVAVVVIALLAAQSKKKKFAYGFALTFAIYVVFDAARQFNLGISQDTLHFLFLIATLSALWSVWQLYKLK